MWWGGGIGVGNGDTPRKKGAEEVRTSHSFKWQRARPHGKSNWGFGTNPEGKENCGKKRKLEISRPSAKKNKVIHERRRMIKWEKWQGEVN